MSHPPRVLITAGPTHEPIDAVRYIGNRSSGQMGIALVEAALSRGWPTTLLLGPLPTDPPQNSRLRTLRFQTAADLEALLTHHWPSHDLLLMAAAIADFRTIEPAIQAKIRRQGKILSLDLESTPDLLEGLSTTTRPDQFVVGFALESPDSMVESARDKLKRKRVDAIVANPLDTMGSPAVSAVLLLANGESMAAPPRMPKADFAAWLLQMIEPMMGARITQRRENA